MTAIELKQIFSLPISQEERKREDFKEIPCKDMDLDCFALDGQVPFGDYRRCYEYAPELGKCVFCENF